MLLCKYPRIFCGGENFDCTFSYAEEKLQIETMSLYLNIGHSAFKSIPMSFQNSIWQCEVDLPAGEHLYKFIVNGELPLCDPYNNLLDLDEDENLCSLLIINDDEAKTQSRGWGFRSLWCKCFYRIRKLRPLLCHKS